VDIKLEVALKLEVLAGEAAEVGVADAGEPEPADGADDEKELEEGATAVGVGNASLRFEVAEDDELGKEPELVRRVNA
jgi:hypothetical protein